ncbi:corrinoid protein [Oceanispirochaeta sp.]|jgi:corrinoid protein of di/trimethylamine methyltransferase|uniref:corrinoid protein n=1 Tax=Oceanispirochaeta sp. TaxID=2035350 RepID=UPI0026314FA7|nr:corrinoid protein [Oceanispirochaeta sp.]
MMADLEQISELMQKGKAKEVKELCQEALDAGIPAQTILDDALLAAMNIVGVKFKNNQVFVPEVLIAARAMNAGLEVLKSELEAGGAETKGKVVLGTVKGDLHDIGKNLVKIMLEGKGLEVIDLGTDVSPEQYVESAKANDANIIAVSALLTTTMTQMENVVKAAVDAGIRDKITIMIGGAPVTQSFCDSIGADIYTPDAATAADKALEVCSK